MLFVGWLRTGKSDFDSKGTRCQRRKQKTYNEWGKNENDDAIGVEHPKQTCKLCCINNDIVFTYEPIHL